MSSKLTKRLYYADPNLLEFEAIVTDSYTEEDRHIVRLNESAFYPTSGGQANDLGTIENIPVVDVFEKEGDVFHVVGNDNLKKDQKVKCHINSERRWHYRRLHSAQHIISAVFYHTFNAKTVSVHLGEVYGAVEFDIELISDENLNKGERICNEKVLSNKLIKHRIVNDDELKNFKLRRPTDRKGSIRLIEIEDTDMTACGGTHCNMTGEIGIIKFLGVKKMRSRVLLEFLCGYDAIEDYKKRFDVSEIVSNRFTCSVNDLPNKIEQLTADLKEAHGKISDLQKELLPIKVKEIAKTAENVTNLPLVITSQRELDNKTAINLATKVAEEINGICALAVENRIVLTSTENSKLNADEIFKNLKEKCSVKGGGSKSLVQIAGLDSTLEKEVIEFIRNMVTHND